MKSAQLSLMAAQLKRARERKGLSQRALADKVGLPQGHISRIERAEVDLQTSNLLQLARALDLELALVPRKALPAIEALSRIEEEAPAHSERVPHLDSLRLKAGTLARKFPQTAVLDRLVRTLNELHEPMLATLSPDRFREFLLVVERIRRILKAISLEPDSGPLGPAFIRTVEALERALRDTRNVIVHGQAARPVTVPAAYTLEDEETDVR